MKNELYLERQGDKVPSAQLMFVFVIESRFLSIFIVILNHHQHTQYLLPVSCWYQFIALSECDLVLKVKFPLCSPLVSGD